MIATIAPTRTATQIRTTRHGWDALDLVRFSIERLSAIVRFLPNIAYRLSRTPILCCVRLCPEDTLVHRAHGIATSADIYIRIQRPVQHQAM